MAVLEMPERLKTELETFELHKQELLAAHHGKFVLIRGAEIVGIWDTYEDALKSGYEKYGISEPFLVTRISGIEGIQYFTRDFASCRS